jgi:hypothetical protein
MESYKNLMKSCVKNNVTIEQMMFLYLIKLKDFLEPKSVSNQYINKVRKFSVEEVVNPLIEGGWLTNFNSEGEYFPELMMATEQGDNLFANYLMGDEFWNAYPAMFPIGNGGKFIARAGIEKDDLIDEYLKKISFDPIKHELVMKRLKIYESLVKKGELNGHKIVDWTRQEMWELIPDNEKPKFGRII